MKTPSVSAVKLLLPLLLFLGMGAHASFAYSLPELQQEDPQTEETIRSAKILTWAIRVNSVAEFSDSSENIFFGNISGKDHFWPSITQINTGDYSSEYKRDIRKLISSLTFPTHFFL